MGDQVYGIWLFPGAWYEAKAPFLTVKTRRQNSLAGRGRGSSAVLAQQSYAIHKGRQQRDESYKYIVNKYISFPSPWLLLCFPLLHANSLEMEGGWRNSGFGLDTASEGADFSGLAFQLQLFKKKLTDLDPAVLILQISNLGSREDSDERVTDPGNGMFLGFSASTISPATERTQTS